MRKNIVVEVCVDSATSAIEAQKGGADRVEICQCLSEGCLTPSYGTVQEARKHLDIALNVMIRPRGGDFCYSEIEFEVMKAEVEMAKELAADGIVFGILKPDGTVDMTRCHEIIELARPLTVTFHRAFDRTVHPIQALEDLISLGVHHVLTSGQRPTAMDGKELLLQLVQQAGDRITVMPGVDIDEHNIQQLIAETGAWEYHILAQKRMDSAMKHRNKDLFSLNSLFTQHHELSITDWERVRDICQIVKII